MSFVEFFEKRYLKLMPLYWLTFIVGIILTYATRNYSDAPISLIELIEQFFGFYSGWFTASVIWFNSPGWTINVLLLCYIIWYIICLISGENENKYLILCIGMLTVGMLGIYLSWEMPFLNGLSLRAYSAYAIGLLSYEIHDKISEKGGFWISIVMLFLFAFANLFEIVRAEPVTVILGGDARISVLLFCPMVLFCSIYVKPIKYILGLREVSFFGRISMSIYLWHYPVSFILGVWVYHYFSIEKFWIRYIIYIICTLGISIISHFILEKILIKYTHVLFSKIKKMGG